MSNQKWNFKYLSNMKGYSICNQLNVIKMDTTIITYQGERGKSSITTCVGKLGKMVKKTSVDLKGTCKYLLLAR